MKSPLKDVKILDASRVLAGPYASMMLGDLGADVVKVERPDGGDQTREWGPPKVGDQSAYYLSTNRNKRSITINLKTEEGREVFRKLAEDSDVIIENFRTGGMEKFGLGYEDLKKLNPSIIYCSITGYGETGPWKNRPAYDIILQAEGGFMSITGEEDGPPVRIGVALVDIITALYATQSILAALHERGDDEEGQKIDVSMFDCEISTLTYMANYYFATGQAPKRNGSKHPTIAPYQAFETKDDYVIIGAGSQAIWNRFCEAIERDDLKDDPRFEDNSKRVENREELESILIPLFKKKTTAEWVSEMKAKDVPATSVNDMEEVFDTNQVEARNMLRSVNHPTIGELQSIGIPIKLGKTPGSIRKHPPLLGEHNEEVLQELGYGESQIDELRRAGAI